MPMISQVWSTRQLQDFKALLTEAVKASQTVDDLLNEIDIILDKSAYPVIPKTKRLKLYGTCPSCKNGQLYKCPASGALVCSSHCGYSKLEG